MQANLGYSAEELEPVDVTDPVNLPAPRQLPPYNGYGSLEDSANSCIHLVPHSATTTCSAWTPGMSGCECSVPWAGA